MTTKEAALRVIDSMPDEFSWDELLCRFDECRSRDEEALRPSEIAPENPQEYWEHVRREVEQSDREFAEGKYHTLEEVEKHFAKKWHG